MYSTEAFFLDIVGVMDGIGGLGALYCYRCTWIDYAKMFGTSFVAGWSKWPMTLVMETADFYVLDFGCVSLSAPLCILLWIIGFCFN